MLSIVLPDDSKKELEEGATAADLAASIGPGLQKAALAVTINGVPSDLSTPLHDGDNVAILTDKQPDGLAILRHSTAHILAEAVMELFGDVALGYGPAIENGFYYDFQTPDQITPESFEKIEARMREIIAADKPFVREVVSRQKAQEIFADQPLKLETLDELDPSEEVVVYRHGDHVELCHGPHVPSAGKIPSDSFEIARTSGAYWKGDSSKQMLQRVYGNQFATKKELKAFREMIEEAKARDHRILGPRLGIFETFEEVGPGLPLFFPNGARVVRTLQEWLRRDLYAAGYEEVITPHIYKSDVWKTSGHYDFYQENMYFFTVNEKQETDGISPTLKKSEAGEGQEFGVKPMNCPGHVLLYKSNLHSYRDLPLRYFEFGTVYRHELSGAVNGLFRARGFTQDDAHIFCREDQVIDEVTEIMKLVDHIMSTFDLSYEAEISTRPAHSIGTDDMWDKAENFLKEACKQRNIPFDINEGDGAFYGPKIDITVKDSIGRTWQCSTIQVDFNLPERFDLTYRTKDNATARPWMLHRAIFGSIERFLGILIEHYAGALPLWLAPVQAVIIPIADRHLDYAEKIAREMRAVGGRVDVDTHSEPMRAKIAKAQEQKIPYMLIVGDKEAQDNTVSVRERKEGDLGIQSVEDFTRMLADAQV